MVPWCTVWGAAKKSEMQPHSSCRYCCGNLGEQRTLDAHEIFNKSGYVGTCMRPLVPPKHTKRQTSQLFPYHRITTKPPSEAVRPIGSWNRGVSIDRYTLMYVLNPKNRGRNPCAILYTHSVTRDWAQNTHPNYIPACR